MSKDTPVVHGAMGRLACSGLLAAAFSFAAVTDEAWAYSDGQVIRGNVTFNQNGNTLIITASDGSIIEFANFNILPHETVRFMQPGDWARVLNRITGGEPTLIQGRLLANGQVYLVNPAGVIFGKDSVVNVGTLYAAAGQMSNADFVNGVDRFTNLQGAVVNEGQLRAGSLHLLGQHVANHGLLKANEGVITMVAGNEVMLKRVGERITVRVDGDWLTEGGPRHGSSNPNLSATPGVENTGTVIANGGQVFLGAGDMYSLAVKNSGVVKAAGGEIRLAAKDGAVHNTGRLLAHVSEGDGGSITMQGPSVVNSGDLLAHTRGNGQGGHIEVTSQNHTYLLNGSTMSVAGGLGYANGGSVLVHSYEGLTVFSNGAQIDARGGRMGGNGGFVEVSGEMLVFNGRVLLNSYGPGSQAGTLLIDPRDITIADVGTDDGFVNDGTINFNEPDQLTDITISDEALEAIVGDILLQATRDIFVNQQVDLTNGNNITFEAWRDIHMNARINGANNVVLLADSDGNAVGVLQFNVPLLATGTATFDGATINLNGGSINSAGGVNFNAPVVLLSNSSITGATVNFNDNVNGTRNLFVTGDTMFNGLVGNNAKVNILRVTGDAAINGGFVSTQLDQLYLGDVTLGADTIMQGTTMSFNGTVDGTNVGQEALSLQGSGTFRGAVGGNVQLESLKVNGKARIDGGLVNTQSTQSYQDNVTFGNDTLLSGSVILFGGPVDALAAGQQGFEVQGDVEFGGEVGGLVPLKYITVIGNTTVGGGLIRAEGDIYLGGVNTPTGGIGGGAVILTADALIESLSGNVTVDGTIDGGFNGTLRAADTLRITGNVGGIEALASVDLGANLIVLGGSLVRTLGDIKLNAAGRADIPVAATIVGTGDLTFESANGNFTMGQHEKLTVLGNLVVDAANGTATLSDITTLNDMTITAQQIEILLREGGMVLLSDGSFAQDGGVDFVAGGNINFSSTPTLVGTGRGPVFGSAGGNPDVAGTLAAFDIVAIDPITIDDLTYSPGKGDAIVLDFHLVVSDNGGGNGGGGNGGGGNGGGGNGGGTPTDDDQPNGLAEAVGDSDLLPIDRSVLSDPIARDDLSRMGIELRGLDPVRDVTSGLRVIDDLQPAPGASTIVVNEQRLSGRAISRAINAFRALGLNTDDVNAADTVRQQVSDAWSRYTSESGSTDAAGFVAWAQSQSGDPAADAVVNVAALWQNMQVSGLNEAELQVVASNVLSAVLPASIDRQAFGQQG